MSEAPGILSGELGLIGLFDLGQLLMLNRASGVLTVMHSGQRGTLVFRQGQLVNAVDDQRKQGEDAAYRVFTWKHGHFEFHAGETEGAAVIAGGTESNMLEAARRIDEASQAGGENTGETARLVERQSQFDLLRDEFSRLAREVASETRRAPDWIDPWLEMLHMPTDRLLARPGAVPRIFVHGAWHPAGEGDAPIDAVVFDELKARMLEGGPADDQSAPTLRRVMRHRGRSFAITLVRGSRECLWVGPAVGATVSGEPVRGPFEALDQLFAQPSAMLLVAASNLDTLHMLLRALVVRLCESRGVAVIVVTEDPLLAPPESTGVVLSTPAHEVESMIQAARPGAIAVDALSRLGAPVVTALATTPIVIGAVVAAQPEAIVPRWLMRFDASDLARAQSLVESSPVAVALAGPASAGGMLTFTVHRVARDGNSPASLRDPFSPVDLLR